eukprot:14408230-Alexandrium_andersonii.AAC.1
MSSARRPAPPSLPTASACRGSGRTISALAGRWLAGVTWRGSPRWTSRRRSRGLPPCLTRLPR